MGPVRSPQFTQFEEAYDAYTGGFNESPEIVESLFQSAKRRYKKLAPSETSHPLSRIIAALRKLWERICACFCGYQVTPITENERKEAQKFWDALNTAHARRMGVPPTRQTPSPPRLSPIPAAPRTGVGLRREGNNCWCNNGFLQPMLHIRPIREAYEEVAEALIKDENSQIRAAEHYLKNAPVKLSLEKAKTLARKHGENLKKVITNHEAALAGDGRPLPSEISQDVRSAFHFLAPKSFDPSSAQQEDAHEPFVILNNTYSLLFDRNAPYALQATIYKKYRPIGKSSKMAITNPKGPNDFFTTLDKNNGITSTEVLSELQFAWKEPLPCATLLRNYFSENYRLDQEEEPAVYMQADGEVKSFVKIHQTVSLDAPPEGFMVILKRFGNSSLTGPFKKIDEIEMPLDLQLPDSSNAGGHTYSLINIIVHLSSPEHYVDYLRDTAADPWVEADDSSFSFCGSKEISVARKTGYLFYYTKTN